MNDLTSRMAQNTSSEVTVRYNTVRYLNAEENDWNLITVKTPEAFRLKKRLLRSLIQNCFDSWLQISKTQLNIAIIQP